MSRELVPLGIINLTGYSSFDATMRLCEIAEILAAPIAGVILGKTMIVGPKTDPHEIYKLTFPEYGT